MTVAPSNPSEIKGSGILGGGGCFVADTLIWTEDGTKPIRDIREGDRVLCFDSHRKLHFSEVIATSFHCNYDVWRYRFWGGEFIATPNHYVYTEQNAFQEIGKLERDAPLYNSSWQVLPLESSVYIGKANVYNFWVAGYHTYFVTESAIAVHNGKHKKGAYLLQE
jgi:hypothetical protein